MCTNYLLTEFVPIIKYTNGFSLPRERYDEKNYNYNDKTKIGICRSNMVPTLENACVEIGKNTDNSNYDGARIERLNI